MNIFLLLDHITAAVSKAAPAELEGEFEFVVKLYLENK